MSLPEDNRLAWRKSSYSGTQADCVEIAFDQQAVAVRDSKNPTGPTLAVDPSAFTTFLTTLRA
ncbi:MAG TPA: DUF397 domain-containing protein [Pseudonocardiaceae bacterium]